MLAFWEVASHLELQRYDTNGETLEKARFGTLPGTQFDYSMTPGTWSALAVGPSGLMALLDGITIEAGVASGLIALELEPAGDLVLQRAPESPRRAFEVKLRRSGTVFRRHTISEGESMTILVPPGPIEVSVIGAEPAGRPVHNPSGGETSILLSAPDGE